MGTTRIGWIGLGNMGIPMAKRIVQNGFDLKVYNRNKSREDSLISSGAAAASSPKELLEITDIVFITVSDDKAIDELFSGELGLLAATGVTGKIIVNMSTVSPGISKKYASLLQEQQNSYLDAPVSGSIKQAIEGQLVIMVGGNQEIYDKVKPVFDILGKLSRLVGSTGAGNSAKLAINVLLGLVAQGLSETLIFARQHGIKSEDILELIDNSALGNVFMKIKGNALLNENFNAIFALKHIAKDLRLAKNEGLNTPLGEVAYETFQSAEKTYGEQDIIAIIKHLEL